MLAHIDALNVIYSIAWQYDKFQAAVLLVGEGPETDLPSW